MDGWMDESVSSAKKNRLRRIQSSHRPVLSAKAVDKCLLMLLGKGDKTKQADSNSIILRMGGKKKKQKCGLGLFDLIDWKFWRKVKRWAMRS